MRHSLFIKLAVVFALASGIVPGQSAKPITNVEHTNGSQAAVVAALAIAAPSQLHNLILARWHPTLATKEPVWRTNLDGKDVRQMLLRWDNRSPDIVFTQGFPPQSKHQNAQDFDWDILQFAAGTYSPLEVPYVSTTVPYFAENGDFVQWQPAAPSDVEYLYEIFAPGGIDVNLTLEDSSPHPELREVVFPGGIRPEFIRSVRILFLTEAGLKINYIAINPGFVGVEGLQAVRVPKGNGVIIQWDHNKRREVDQDKNESSATFTLDPMKRRGSLQVDRFPDDPKTGRRIPEGFFAIAPLVDVKKVINTVPKEIEGEDWAVITKDTKEQYFKLVYHSDEKAYTIRSGSNFLMPAADDRVRLIELLAPDFWKEAYWVPEWLGRSNHFLFRNLKHTSLLLKVASVTPADGSIVQVGELDSSMTYKWLLKPIFKNILFDGEYQICSSWFPNKVVSADQPTDTNPEQPALLMENYRNDSQEYKFIYNNKESAYSIQDVTDTRNYLVRSQNNSGVVKLKVDELAVGQYWKVLEVDGKTYKLRTNGNSSEVLHLLGGHPTDEASIIVKQAISRFAKGQNWVFQRVLPDPVAEGTYEISTIENPNQLITCRKPIEGLTEKSTVDMSHNTNNAAQKWNFQYYPAKRAYRISNLSDEKCVLVCDVNTEEVFGDYIAEDNGYWKIELTADGYYILRNAVNTSKSLYLPNEDVADGDKVSCSRQGGNPLRLWRLHRRDAPIKPPDVYVIARSKDASRVWGKYLFNEVRLQGWNAVVEHYWSVGYDAKKDAYTIHPTRDDSRAVLYTSEDAPVSLSSIGSDLKAYWLIEDNMGHGGYVFRSLHNPDQAIDFETTSLKIVTRPLSYNEDQTWKMSLGKKYEQTLNFH